MIIQDILKLKQKTLKQILVKELKRYGYQPIAPKGYVYAAGKIPVLLTAHMDTVHYQPVKVICSSPDNTVLMSPQGIGGDDRAGVYMILQLIKEKRCHVLFCEDEETGAYGAEAFATSNIKPKVNYIVGLDRRGRNDAVYYNCDNSDFTKFVSSFDFTTATGSFSDISVIAPKLGIAAVNISAGYFNEHTKHEYIDMTVVNINIKRIKSMVSARTPFYPYMAAKHNLDTWDYICKTYDKPIHSGTLYHYKYDNLYDDKPLIDDVACERAYYDGYTEGYTDGQAGKEPVVIDI